MRIIWLALSSFLVCFWCSQALAFQTIVLVRHAEKVDESRDPLLSEQGQKRAKDLARLLRDTGIEQVYVSEYQRTLMTAKPLLETQKIEVLGYLAKDSLQLGTQLLSTTKNTLVVAHSNTVNTVLKGLGILDAKPIADDEFDRVVIVQLPKQGPPLMLVLRY